MSSASKILKQRLTSSPNPEWWLSVFGVAYAYGGNAAKAATMADQYIQENPYPPEDEINEATLAMTGSENPPVKSIRYKSVEPTDAPTQIPFESMYDDYMKEHNEGETDPNYIHNIPNYRSFTEYDPNEKHSEYFALNHMHGAMQNLLARSGRNARQFLEEGNDAHTQAASYFENRAEKLRPKFEVAANRVLGNVSAKTGIDGFAIVSMLEDGDWAPLEDYVKEIVYNHGNYNDEKANAIVKAWLTVAKRDAYWAKKGERTSSIEIPMRVLALLRTLQDESNSGTKSMRVKDVIHGATYGDPSKVARATQPKGSKKGKKGRKPKQKIRRKGLTPPSIKDNSPFVERTNYFRQQREAGSFLPHTGFKDDDEDLKLQPEVVEPEVQEESTPPPFERKPKKPRQLPQDAQTRQESLQQLPPEERSFSQLRNLLVETGKTEDEEQRKQTFDQFAVQSKPLINRIIRKLGAKGDEFDNLKQKLLLQIYKNAGTYKAEGAFYNWINHIAKNLLTNERIAANTIKRSSERTMRGDLDSLPSNRSRSAPTTNPEVSEHLREAITKLPEKQRRTIEALLSGESQSEIARREGVDRTAVNERVMSAKAKLRQLLTGSKGIRYGIKNEEEFNALFEPDEPEQTHVPENIVHDFGNLPGKESGGVRVVSEEQPENLDDPNSPKRAMYRWLADKEQGEWTSIQGEAMDAASEYMQARWNEIEDMPQMEDDNYDAIPEEDRELQEHENRLEYETPEIQTIQRDFPQLMEMLEQQHQTFNSHPGREIVHQYSNVLYTKINDALRYNHPRNWHPKTKNAIKMLDGFLHNTRLPTELVLYRNVDLDVFDGDPAKFVGQEFTDKAYASTTLYESKAHEFGGAVIMKITTKPGQRGFMMNANEPAVPNEYEILLPRKTAMRIKQVRPLEHGRWEIEMEVI